MILDNLDVGFNEKLINLALVHISLAIKMMSILGTLDFG